MYELRRIQHGDRPVTGQGSKEAVEQFFSRALSGDTGSSRPEENRPEHVVVEVNALVERRPVSSLLQSRGFRRNLEGALRGALINISRQPAAVRPRQRATETVQQRPQPQQSSQLDAQGRRSSDDGGEALPASANRPVPAPRRSLLSRSSTPLSNTEAASDHDNIQPSDSRPNESFAQEWVQRNAG